MVCEEDDFSRIALTGFKTILLVQTDATRLALSLQTFAGTMCTNDELAQVFIDVSRVKQQARLQCDVTILSLASDAWRWVTFCQGEDVLYGCVAHLGPSQFVEALRFSDGLFGL